MGELLKVMTLNIGNPSLKRAKRQIEWLERQDDDVFVLTETKKPMTKLWPTEHSINFSQTEISQIDIKFDIHIYVALTDTQTYCDEAS